MKRILLTLCVMVIAAITPFSSRAFEPVFEGLTTLKPADDLVEADKMIAGLAGMSFTTITPEGNGVFRLNITMSNDVELDIKIIYPTIVNSNAIRFTYFEEGQLQEIIWTPEEIILAPDLIFLTGNRESYDAFYRALAESADSDSSGSFKKLSTVPRDLSLAVERNGVRYYVTQEQWKSVPDKDKYQIVGIVLQRGGQKFIVAYNDEYDAMDGYGTWSYDMYLYSDNIPTKAQADIIAGCTNLRDVAAAFGQDNYGNYYWTSTRCPAPDENYAYIFCPGIPDAALDRSPIDEVTNVGVLLVYPLP